jgi:hypothetical protein
MSNLKESIKAIFQKFAVDPKAYGINLETEVQLETEGRLKDGTPVYTSAEAFAIGVDVYTKDEEGNKMPAAAGRYELESGEFIDVDEMGMVAEMGIPEMEDVEMSSADVISMVEKLTDRVSFLEGNNSTLAAELTAAEDKIEMLSAALKNSKTELSSLKKQPAATSVKENKKVILGAEKKEKSFAQMTLRERILQNIENIK